MRVSMLSYKMPELNGPNYGCFSKLPRHPPSEGQRYFQTTYRDSYSQRFNEHKYTPKPNSAFQVEHKFCGSASNWQPADRLKITTQLISEKYNNYSEPKYNTEVQRTWINHRDPAVRAVTDLGIDNTKINHSLLPRKDNGLSLTMQSDKLYNDLKAKTFYGCPKKFTDVTKTTYHVSNLRKYD